MLIVKNALLNHLKYFNIIINHNDYINNINNNINIDQIDLVSLSKELLAIINNFTQINDYIKKLYRNITENCYTNYENIIENVLHNKFDEVLNKISLFKERISFIINSSDMKSVFESLIQHNTDKIVTDQINTTDKIEKVEK